MTRRTALAKIASTFSLGLLGSFSLVKKAEAAQWKKLQALSAFGDRGVYAWGNSSSGQLGNNFTGCKSVPVAVGGLSNVVALASGGAYHKLFLLSTGSVMGVGYNYEGELGDNTVTPRSIPVAVCGISTAVALAGGAFHSVALLSTGSVMAWGTNTCGQAGNNTVSAAVSTPVAVCGITTATAIVAGTDFSLALLSSGCLVAWGVGTIGQLGNNAITCKSTPVAVCGLSNVVAIAAGATHGLALMANGCIMSWGSNLRAQLGDNTITCRSTPVAVCGITNAVAVAAGGSLSFALLADGTIKGWGYDTGGALGDGTSGADKSTPVSVSGISTAVTMAVGSNSSMALLANGSLMSWGRNLEGELGNCSLVSTCTPVAVCSVVNSFASVTRAKSQRRYAVLSATADAFYFLHLG